jgi:hypothetical protein
MDLSYLLANKVTNFYTEEVNFSFLSKYKELVRDNTYFDLIIQSQNGGYFYGQALHIYGYSTLQTFHDISYVNTLLEKEYGSIFNELVAFGQDLFGNQFCFDKSNSGIIFFNSETGEKERIAIDFATWVGVLDDQLEYLTGIKVLETWLSHDNFEFGQRLCPKIPFIMGGEYKIDNLYAGIFPNYIKAYANIAKQVYNLPDGTRVNLKVDKK